MENQTVGLAYGILAESLSKQLDKQGLKYNKKKMKQFEEQREAINILRFSDLVTDTVIDKLVPKLHKKIIAHVAKENS